MTLGFSSKTLHLGALGSNETGLVWGRFGQPRPHVSPSKERSVRIRLNALGGASQNRQRRGRVQYVLSERAIARPHRPENGEAIFAGELTAHRASRSTHNETATRIVIAPSNKAEACRSDPFDTVFVIMLNSWPDEERSTDRGGNQ